MAVTKYNALKQIEETIKVAEKALFEAQRSHQRLNALPSPAVPETPAKGERGDAGKPGRAGVDGNPGRDAVGVPGAPGARGEAGRDGQDAPQREELDAVKREMVQLRSDLINSVISELRDHLRCHDGKARAIDKLTAQAAIRISCLSNGKDGKDGNDGKNGAVPGPQGPRGEVLIPNESELAAAVTQLRAEKARFLAAIGIQMHDNELRKHDPTKSLVRFVLQTIINQSR